MGTSSSPWVLPRMELRRSDQAVGLLAVKESALGQTSLLSVVTERYLTKAFPSLHFYKGKEVGYGGEGENYLNSIISNINPSHISLHMTS